MSRRQLTHKQHTFLEFLREHVRERKVWPTYREIVDHFDYRSPNSVTQNLQALAKKGYLRRDDNGYHLVDREGKDGSVPLRGAIRDGRLEDGAGSERLSLAALFPDVSGLHAYRHAGAIRRPPTSGHAQNVRATNDPAAGDLDLVPHEGRLTQRTVSADRRLTAPDGTGEALARAEVEVLGR